jgi:cell wall assembly regulator SMI1
VSGSGSDGFSSRTFADKLARLFGLLREQTGLDSLPFNEGCSRTELLQLEERVEVQLPDDYRTFLEHANGQSDWHTLVFPPDQLAFLATDDVLELWEQFNQFRDEQFIEQLRCDERVRAVLYHPERLPIAYNEAGGRYLCIDTIPGPNGRSGQLVFNVNEVDVVVLEDSFAHLIERYVSLLETRRMSVEKQPPEYGEGYWFTADGHYVDFERYLASRAGG